MAIRNLIVHLSIPANTTLGAPLPAMYRRMMADEAHVARRILVIANTFGRSVEDVHDEVRALATEHPITAVDAVEVVWRREQDKAIGEAEATLRQFEETFARIDDVMRDDIERGFKARHGPRR